MAAEVKPVVVCEGSWNLSLINQVHSIQFTKTCKVEERELCKGQL